MRTAKETGDLGEEYARRHLLRNGYEVLESNWRYKKWEVDLIARVDTTLVFIEVKTRTSEYFGPPSSFFTAKQARRITGAAAQYMVATGHDRAIRFDFISILIDPLDRYTLKHMEDVFFPGLTDYK